MEVRKERIRRQHSSIQIKNRTNAVRIALERKTMESKVKANLKIER